MLEGGKKKGGRPRNQLEKLNSKNRADHHSTKNAFFISFVLPLPRKGKMIDSHIQKKDVPVYLTFLFVRLYFTHCNQRRGKKIVFFPRPLLSLRPQNRQGRGNIKKIIKKPPFFCFERLKL